MSINDIVFKKITFALNYSVKAFLNKERVTNFALFGAYFIFLSYNNFKDFNFLILFFLVVISFDFILKIKNVLYNVLVFSLLYSMIVYYDTLFIVHEMRISYFIVIFTSITAITFIIIDKYKLEYYTNIFLLFLLVYLITSSVRIFPEVALVFMQLNPAFVAYFSVTFPTQKVFIFFNCFF